MMANKETKKTHKNTRDRIWYRDEELLLVSFDERDKIFLSGLLTENELGFFVWEGSFYKQVIISMYFRDTGLDMQYYGKTDENDVGNKIPWRRNAEKDAEAIIDYLLTGNCKDSENFCHYADQWRKKLHQSEEDVDWYLSCMTKVINEIRDKMKQMANDGNLQEWFGDSADTSKILSLLNLELSVVLTQSEEEKKIQKQRSNV